MSNIRRRLRLLKKKNETKNQYKKRLIRSLFYISIFIVVKGFECLIKLFCFCAEKCVGQGDGFDVIHAWIIIHGGVDEEEDGHVHAFLGSQCLFIEAKALNFVEVFSGFERGDVVNGGAGGWGGLDVGGAVGGDSALAELDFDFALFGAEIPRQVAIGFSVEFDCDRAVEDSAGQAFGGLCCAAEAGDAAKEIVEGHTGVCQGDHANDDGQYAEAYACVFAGHFFVVERRVTHSCDVVPLAGFSMSGELFCSPSGTPLAILIMVTAQISAIRPMTMAKTAMFFFSFVLCRSLCGIQLSSDHEG